MTGARQRRQILHDANRREYPSMHLNRCSAQFIKLLQLLDPNYGCSKRALHRSMCGVLGWSGPVAP